MTQNQQAQQALLRNLLSQAGYSDDEEEEEEDTEENCEDCTCYFPNGAEFCLAGHCDRDDHPCVDYDFAIFYLVEFPYTPEQLFKLRELEREMKRRFTGD